jgi:hypothetical protein
MAGWRTADCACPRDWAVPMAITQQTRARGIRSLDRTTGSVYRQRSARSRNGNSTCRTAASCAVGVGRHGGRRGVSGDVAAAQSAVVRLEALRRRIRAPALLLRRCSRPRFEPSLRHRDIGHVGLLRRECGYLARRGTATRARVARYWPSIPRIRVSPCRVYFRSCRLPGYPGRLLPSTWMRRSDCVTSTV